MFDLAQFSLSNGVSCGAELRAIGSDCSSMEETADQVVAYLYDNLGDSEGAAPGCALVRFYVTLPLADLEPGLQQFAWTSAGPPQLAPTTKCLTLLASRGLEPAWNSRHTSVGQ
jgi:hypothetical protein